MKIIRTIRALQLWRARQSSRNVHLGFVPTMGAFHAGHQSLMQRARRSCGTVVVSIFVNPLQFGPTEDLDEYPRPRQTDLALCRQAGVDVVFVPSRKDFYPPGFQTSVTVGVLTRPWEGAHRRTHFQGVTTVVAKLLNLVKPHRAFLGQKDYQQCCILNQMVTDLGQGVNMVMCPTIRESDGLALSSRNGYLSSSARRTAPVLYQALNMGASSIREGETSIKRIETVMQAHIRKTSNAKIDYLAVCHTETLEPLNHTRKKMVLLGAVRLGKVRLIDNVIVNTPV
ncbi:MAG: pantothenate synthetase [Nitrospirales bacterium]|nr:MAG: pantothenate synthetase [Nitrospirales bacterium]